MRVVELAVAGLFVLLAARSAVRSLHETPSGESFWDQILIAVYVASGTGFWLALAAVFVAFALVEEFQTIRWFAFAPVGMAGARLVSAALLSREQ